MLVASTHSHNSAVQVLTAIEMARSARVAANKAFFAGLTAGKPGCAADMASAPFLAVNDPLVLHAARNLARKAAHDSAVLQASTPARKTPAHAAPFSLCLSLHDMPGSSAPSCLTSPPVKLPNNTSAHISLEIFFLSKNGACYRWRWRSGSGTSGGSGAQPRA